MGDISIDEAIKNFKLIDEEDSLDNKVTITVVNTPEYITCYCPHCDEEIKIPYSDFLNIMPKDAVIYGSDYRDWMGEKFKCPECSKEIEVEYVDRN